MEIVKFIYKDGFLKCCSRKEAEVLEMMGRGKIDCGKPTVKDEPKPVEVPKPVEEPVKVKHEAISTEARVVRRGRQPKV